MECKSGPTCKGGIYYHKSCLTTAPVAEKLWYCASCASNSLNVVSIQSESVSKPCENADNCTNKSNSICHSCFGKYCFDCLIISNDLQSYRCLNCVSIVVSERTNLFL